MKVLVTGGAGFIASHRTDELLKRGHEVAILDNLSTGKREFLNPDARFYNMDITDPAIERVFREFSPELVYHHAAQIDVQHSLRDPVHDANVNILGTIAILEQSRKHGVRKIVYASSAAVYGPPDFLPVDESHPVRPLSYYGISKHTPEHYIQAYANLYGLDYTILRYANAYGIRQDPKGEGGVISIFLDKLLNGQQTVIYGDGEQTRDFVYVKDIVSANIAAMTRGSRGLFNISRNEQTSVNELLSLMNEILDSDAIPAYAPARPADIVHSCLNNEAAIRELEWTPAFSVRQGLQETCAYYANLRMRQASTL